MSKKVVTIDRSKWITGEQWHVNHTGIGTTKLKNEEGHMCCLGFVCSQLSDVQLNLEVEPEDLGVEIPEISEHEERAGVKVLVNTNLSNEAMGINDSVDTTPEEKEKLLKKLFKETNIELVFTGEYTR